MSEMIVRVARAMYDAYPILDENEVPLSWEDLEREGDRNPCMLCARAAIGAMREPTEAMIEVGSDTSFIEWSLEEGEGADGLDSKALFIAMIDAALGRSRDD